LMMNALNFKKALSQSPNMIALRLSMRDAFRSQLNYLNQNDLLNPNIDRVDIFAGDK
jgi:hypothetical protein